MTIQYPYVINNFKYNGFMGVSVPGKASYTAKFNKWTNDPGIVQMDCSDGRLRFIPTYAIPDCSLLPKQIIDPDKKEIFGRPCYS